MSPARFRWGMMLILVGVLLMMSRMDLLAYHFWYGFAVFFPLFLIAVGIEKIFSKTRFKFISYATTVALFAGAIFLATEDSSDSYTADFFDEISISEDEPDGIEILKALIKLDDGELTVREATDYLVSGHFRENTHKPRWEFKYENEEAFLKLTQRSDALFGGMVHIVTDEPEDWYLSFSNHIPLDLVLVADESDLHLNMAATPLRKLAISSDDTEIYLKLGLLEPLVTIELEGDDSDLRLRIPRDVGLRVTGYAEEYLEHIGLLQQNGVYMTDGYNTFENKIKLDLNKNNSLRIDYY